MEKAETVSTVFLAHTAPAVKAVKTAQPRLSASHTGLKPGVNEYAKVICA
jgi:hypothetical protein